jgi:hypothetical protein
MPPAISKSDSTEFSTTKSNKFFYFQNCSFSVNDHILKHIQYRYNFSEFGRTFLPDEQAKKRAFRSKSSELPMQFPSTRSALLFWCLPTDNHCINQVYPRPSLHAIISDDFGNPA